jgi:hypothetical protein
VAGEGDEQRVRVMCGVHAGEMKNKGSTTGWHLKYFGRENNIRCGGRRTSLNPKG